MLAEMDRRQFLGVMGAGALREGMNRNPFTRNHARQVGASSSHDTQQSLSNPQDLQSAIPVSVIPDYVPRTFSPDRISTILESSQSDSLQDTLNQAEKDETVTIPNVQIGSVYRINLIKEFYVATVRGIADDGTEKTLAAVTQAKKIFDALADAGELPGGDATIRWDIADGNTLPQLNSTVKVSHSAVTPLPVIEADEVDASGQAYTEHETTVPEKVEEFLSSIDWDDIPEDVGDFFARAYYDFIRGVHHGSS